MENTQETGFKHVFSTPITEKLCSDTGMAMVLIALIAGLYTENYTCFKVAFGLLLVNMIYPKIFYYVAVLWFGFSVFMGTITSKIILTVIFGLFVLPMGFARRLLGKDPMQLRQWKKSTKSVMVVRNKIFVAKDLKNPF